LNACPPGCLVETLEDEKSRSEPPAVAVH